MRFNQRLELGFDYVAVVIKVHDARDPHGACTVTAGLAEVHARHAALRGIAGVGTVVGSTHGGGGIFVFDRHIVQLHARAAARHESGNGEGKSNTFHHPNFS
eukprot:gene14489-14611_t